MQAIELKTSAAGGVTWEQVDESHMSPAEGKGGKAPKEALKVKVPKWCGQWAVRMDEYKDGVVGAKSKNIAGRCSMHS